FQAEDGIRDRTVTGVQTCALPIYSREFLDYIRNTPIKAERGSASGRALVEGRVVHIPDVKADPEYTFVEAPRLGDFRTALCVPRSEERRVGKECRSRRAPCQSKKR